MNCHQIHELWDDARDGDLPAAKQQAFDEHLAACGRCAALWKAESAWLNMLAKSAALKPGEREFAQQVLAAWHDGQGTQDDGVVGRVGGAGTGAEAGMFSRTWVRAVVAVAAVAVLSVTLWLTANPPSPPPPTSAPPAIVQQPKPDPVATLVGDFSQQYAAGPATLRQGFDRTREMLRLERVTALLDNLSVPDPADYVEQ